MKKYVLVLLAFLVMVSGCGGKKNNEVSGNETSAGGSSGSLTNTPSLMQAQNVINVRENMFITQINDINLNYKTYLGKTVKIEGMFKEFQWDGKIMYYVYRKAPGCCGNDGEVGFEMSWDQNYQGYSTNLNVDTPGINDWVEVHGVLKSYEQFDHPFLYIAIDELNVLDKRGAEFVSR